MPSKEEISFAQILWDFHKIDQPLEKVDLIFGLGSYDLRVADHCAKLALEGFAPRILFSGSQGNFTRGKWSKSEAEMFADRALDAGVSPGCILIEPKATNTGDNVRFARKLLDAKGIKVSSVILVSKPNMNRRGWATMKKLWPKARVVCSHPKTHFLHNPADGHTPEDIINEIVGDLQRIIEYPKCNFQTPQEIPLQVSNAYEKLVELGYTGHMLKQ
ncbi:YdcF family protein [Akkermansiaceae bacterium]|nr:YdcF family protein [Akkermansiaceae bacterium]